MRIGTHIGINRAKRPASGSAATGILDSYPVADFAYAVDTLLYGSHSVTDTTIGSETNGQTKKYTVVVERSSDNALRSFTYNEVGDGTLTTWIGANDGAVVKIYDQTGNGRHQEDSIAAGAPTIVTAGTLETVGGNAVLFSGSMASSSFVNGSAIEYITSMAVLELGASTRAVAIDVTHPNGVNQTIRLRHTRYEFFYNLNVPAGNINLTTTNPQAGLYLHYSQWDITGGSVDYYRNNSLVGSISPTAGTYGSSVSELAMNMDVTGPAKLAAIVGFFSDQSANRPALATALNNNYSIY